MGQFSMVIYTPPGSLLSGNQQREDGHAEANGYEVKCAQNARRVLPLDGGSHRCLRLKPVRPKGVVTALDRRGYPASIRVPSEFWPLSIRHLAASEIQCGHSIRLRRGWILERSLVGRSTTLCRPWSVECATLDTTFSLNPCKSGRSGLRIGFTWSHTPQRWACLRLTR